MFQRPPAGRQAAALINAAVVVVAVAAWRPALEPTAFLNYQKTKSDSWHRHADTDSRTAAGRGENFLRHKYCFL